MFPLKRRHFLQLLGSAIATTSLSNCNFIQSARQLERNLSRGSTSSRKLALLIGINAYPPESEISALNGCLTDVELQRHLLIYRFGFNPNDILILTDERATRQNILTAFEEHLIKQAKPEDIVVFHYSGHGSQVVDRDRDFPDGLNSTLVPVDSSRPAKVDASSIVQDITGHTLFLLMAAINTENVTFILDCCYSGGAKRGNLLVRSLRGGAQFQASPEEYKFQDKWLSKLNLNKADFIQQRRAGIAKGVAIAATNRDQLAADYPFNGFHAGAFTYLMSQYLWQQAGAIAMSRAIAQIAAKTTQISFTLQQPEFEVKPGSRNEQQPIYFTEPLNLSAEAVITKVEGNFVELWLGGIDSQSLAAFEKDAILAIVDESNRTSGKIQLESRQGLVGRGKLLETISPKLVQPGALCIEQVRGIPGNFSLRVALDPSLGGETAEAIAQLKKSDRLEILPLQQTEVDCILGRKKQGSIGLFSPAFTPIPGSFGANGESVTEGVKRLQSKFKSLLAARLVKMTLNTQSSQLDVTASLNEAGDEKQLLATIFPNRGSRKTELSKKMRSPDSLETVGRKLPLGKAVRLQIVNNETKDLYVSVLVIDPNGDMTIIFPYQWIAAEEAARLGAGQTLLIPDTGEESFELRTQEPRGVTEVLIIASSTPLRSCLKTLQAVARKRGLSRGPVALNNPIEVINNLLEDLGEETRDNAGSRRGVGVIQRVDTTKLAAMSITFEVV